MSRSFALFTLLLVLSSPSWSWVLSLARPGDDKTQPYQSSNPVVFLKDVRTQNQGQSEECYMFAFTTSLEVANKNAWQRETAPPISGEFLVLQKMEEWAKEVWLNQVGLDHGFYYHAGGDVHHSMRLSVERGLIPNSLFREKNRPYTEWNFEKFYQDVRSIVREEKPNLNRANNQQQFNEAYVKAMQRLQSRLYRDVNLPPQKFKFQDRDYTPKTFENAVGIRRNSHIHYIYPAGRWDMGDPWDLRRALMDLVSTFNGNFRQAQVSWKRIWTYVLENLNAGMPTMFSLKWGRSYHVLVATGYEYDSEGRLVTIRMKNTWGDEFGTRGSAVFKPQDLQKNTHGVWGFKAPDESWR
jgi:aminopeptidase C